MSTPSSLPNPAAKKTPESTAEPKPQQELRHNPALDEFMKLGNEAPPVTLTAVKGPQSRRSPGAHRNVRHVDLTAPKQVQQTRRAPSQHHSPPAEIQRGRESQPLRKEPEKSNRFDSALKGITGLSAFSPEAQPLGGEAPMTIPPAEPQPSSPAFDAPADAQDMLLQNTFWMF